jgi:hypothetical protein
MLERCKCGYPCSLQSVAKSNNGLFVQCFKNGCENAVCEITLPWEKIDIVGEIELDVNVNIDCYHKVLVFKFVGFATMWQ